MSQYLRVIDPVAPCTTLPETLAYQYTFPLDPFQQHAIAAISRHENVLVTAKTGSGKTLVGEYQIAHSIAKGKRVFYTTPIKSLSNQKFYDLKRMFPDRVGIMTGDIKFKPDADIVIMTTEILRNLLYKRGTKTESLGLTASLSLNGLDAVVFDECHYINDKDRGAIWEETMILLPPTVNLVLLSATIDSPQQFASWLGDLKEKPIHLISTQYRIVPLVHGVYRGDEFLPVMDSKDKFDSGMYNAWLLWLKGATDEATAHRGRVANRRVGGYQDGPIQRSKDGPKSFLHQMNAMIARLAAAKPPLLPALFFVFSRKDCERYAAKVEHTLIDSSDTATVKHIMDFHLHKYGDNLLRLPQYHTLRVLLEKGIAFHHSGLLPVLKEIVEILFGRGYIKLLFATETFAVGINMPTKTVVFTGLKKYDDTRGGMRLLNTDEYIQMAGRAGRRGKDDRGLVLYLPDREPEDLEGLRSIMTGRRTTFNSQMKFHYDFLLKTLQSGNLRWLDLMKQSYWYRRHEADIAACSREIERTKDMIAGLGLTPDVEATMEEGDILAARVKETVNAARRDAQRSLESWKQRRVGPVWHKIEKELWPQYKRAKQDLSNLERDYLALLEPQRDVEPTLAALRALGFLAEGEGCTLTPLGTMATEINEGHPILMTLLYRDGPRLTDPKEVLALIAVFAGEGSKEENYWPQTVSDPVKAALRWLQGTAKEAAATESAARAVGPYGYWELNTTWVDPVWRWLQGDALASIATDYEIYEGNLIRILSKMANLLEEWRTLATLSSDTATLQCMAEAEQLLLTGIATSDSLYLRL